jgi:hypothetical protein
MISMNKTIQARKTASGLVAETTFQFASQAVAALNSLYWEEGVTKAQRKQINKMISFLIAFVAAEEADDDDPFA